MAIKHYLLCKKCGVHRFYIREEDGKSIYFHVDFDEKPFPTEVSNANLEGLDCEGFDFCACSDKLNVNRLVIAYSRRFMGTINFQKMHVEG